MSDEFEGISKGLGDIAEKVGDVAVNLGTTKDAVEGLTKASNSLSELKEEVTKLPKFLKELLDEVSQVTNGVKSLSEIMQESSETEEAESAEHQAAVNKLGSKEWTEDKVASKLPIAFAAPALFLGTKLDGFLGEGSALINHIDNISKILTENISTQAKKKKSKKASGDDADTGHKAKLSLSEKNIKTTDKAIQAASSMVASMKDLIKAAVFVNMADKIGVINHLGMVIERVKTVYRDPVSGKLRYTAKDLSNIKVTENIMAATKKAMISLVSAMSSAVKAGFLARIATRSLRLSKRFMVAAKRFMDVFGNAAEAEEFALKAQWMATAAWSIKKSFKDLLISIPLIIATGILAIPATVALLGVKLLFKVLRPLLVEVSSLQVNLQNAIPVCLLTVVFAVSMFTAVKLLSKISLKDIGLAVLGLIGSAVIMALLAALGIAATYALAPLSSLADACFLAAAAVIGMTILVVTLKGLNKAMESFAGKGGGKEMISGVAKAFLPMLAIFTMFSVIGLLAIAVKPLIASFTVCVFLSVAAVIGTKFLVKAIKNANDTILGLYKETKQNPLTGQTEEVQNSPVAGMFGAALRLIGLLAPIALLMVAVAAIGIIGIVATIGALGLTTFALLSIAAFKMLPSVIESINSCVKACYNVFAEAGSNSLLGKLADAIEASGAEELKPLRAIGGVIRVLGGLAAIGGVILMTAIVGLLGTIAAPLMLGLDAFTSLAPKAFGGMDAALASISKATEAARKMFFSRGTTNSETLKGLENIPFVSGVFGILGFLATMGDLFAIAQVILMVGGVGLVATAAKPAIQSLSECSASLVTGITDLTTVMNLMEPMTTTANKVMNTAKDGYVFRNVYDTIGKLIESIASIGTILSKKRTQITSLKGDATTLKAGVDALNDAVTAMSSMGGKDTSNVINANIIDPLMKIGQRNGPITLVQKLTENIKNLKDSVHGFANNPDWQAFTKFFDGDGSAVLSLKPQAASAPSASSTTTSTPMLDNEALNQLARDVAQIKDFLKKSPSWTDAD